MKTIKEEEWQSHSSQSESICCYFLHFPSVLSVANDSVLMIGDGLQHNMKMLLKVLQSVKNFEFG